MSNPQNILSKYRSYSYHHILLACDNEASANFIRNSNKLSVFRQLGSTQAVTIDEINEATGERDRIRVGAYVVIINGLLDTTFVVRDVEWFTATAASTDMTDRFTSVAVEGKMTIEEPRGVRFMNALNGACDLLESDPSGVIWMLKTIFVGHGVDPISGDEITDYITDLRPLEFMIYDVTGTFDITGGLYEISFAGVSNGAARFPQYSRIAETISFAPQGRTLADAMATLERNMKTKSAANRKCVIDALKRTYSDIDPQKLEQFRLVDYQIHLEPPLNGDEYVIDGFSEIELSDLNGTGVFKFGPSMTVEQAIRHVMDRCSRVKKDLTEGDEHGIRYSWKIHSEITMTGKGGVDPFTGNEVDTVLVSYRIRRFAEVTNQTVERVIARHVSEDDEVTQAAIQENLIEFDYFFTGRNIDIINFDLKMEMGLAFLQTLGSTNNIGTGTHQITGLYPENVRLIVPTENAKEDPSNPTPKILLRTKTPIFPATNVKNVHTQNVRGPLDTTLFSAMLSRHAALESLEAVVTIHGNPYLMSQTNRRPSERLKRTNAIGTESDPTRVLENWDAIPGLAKINIFMPATNDTPSTQDTFDRERFWYDGYYYIYGIDHKFSGGEFTQDLHLLSLPNESLLLEQQQTDISECGITEVESSSFGGLTTDSAETPPRVNEVAALNARNR